MDVPPTQLNPTTGHSDKFVSIVSIEQELKSAYLDYAMSVIVGRALPDVRDGLKPVHRRVLYAMYDLGNTYQKPYKKSARIVGDVIGKYHPHGDQPVYETIVRLAQDFSLRYPLIDGQGNFGSIDGDPAAAMRYTEIRMQKLTMEMLADLNLQTVDFSPNYDGSLEEPVVLPTKLPNLLINGSTGIAVGMATNIPPHNLSEVSDALIALIDNPELDVFDLLAHIKGPDFPTAGLIFASQGMIDAYTKGKGTITIRGKVNIETLKNEKQKIIITELPYQVNKAKLIEKIADLVKDKRLEGIADLADESDRSGMRIVIDVKKGIDTTVLINQLYKLTPLQDNYSITLLAIEQNKPKVFNLREILWAFIEHRRVIIVKRTYFELKKAQAKAHLLLGYKVILENLDQAIALIRAAASTNIAAKQLMDTFSLSQEQSDAILELKLSKLTSLEQGKILEDYENTLKLISRLQEILSSDEEVFKIIKTEISEIKTQYGDKRRSEIILDKLITFESEDLIADEETLVCVTRDGYIKRTDPSVFKSQHRGGKGIKSSASSNDSEVITNMFPCRTLSFLICLTNRGRAYAVKVYQIPETSRTAKGKAIANLLDFGPKEQIQALIPVTSLSKGQYILLVSKFGIIKKIELNELESATRKAGIIVMSFGEESDFLVDAKLSSGKDEVLISSKLGMSVRFVESDVRAMGRQARGVIGMDLSAEDEVVSMETIHENLVAANTAEILSVTENGIGKRTLLTEYRLASRGAIGVINIKFTGRSANVIGARRVTPTDQLLLVSSTGKMVRLEAAEIPLLGRNTQGVKLISLGDNEKLVAFELLPQQIIQAVD
jgi:DNA gyrase subunit A